MYNSVICLFIQIYIKSYVSNSKSVCFKLLRYLPALLNKQKVEDSFHFFSPSTFCMGSK